MPHFLEDPRPVLVTGAAGFVAFHVVEALLARGRPVVGVDDFDPFYPRALKEENLRELGRSAAAKGVRFRFQELDVRRLDERSIAGENFAAVVHLAARPGVRASIAAPAEYLDANVGGTLNVLEFCRLRGIDRLVFSSSSSVYGDDTPLPFHESAPASSPLSPYAASKRAAELLCRTWSSLHGLRVAALRFFTVYGPRQRPDLAIRRFTEAMQAGRAPTLHGDGRAARDYTWAPDTARGVALALEWLEGTPAGTFEIFNLGTGVATRLSDLLVLIERAVGRTSPVVRGPPAPGDVSITLADTTKAAQVLGWRASVPVEEGIARFVRWCEADAAQATVPLR